MNSEESFYQDAASSRGSVFCILDSLLSLLFVSPLVVAYWRGCWQLMDLLLFPENTMLSIYLSLAMGIILELLACFFQFHLERILDHKKKPKLFLVMSRVYTITFAFACVNHWRGIWQMWDYYTGTEWESALISMVLGIVILIVARGICNICAPPFVFLPDAPKDYFRMSTHFEWQEKLLPNRIFDALYTVIFINSVVVFVWRGAWALLDCFLFPDDLANSALGSLIVGTAFSLTAFLLQCLLPFCSRFAARGKYSKIFITDLNNLFCFAGTVNVWRGVWVGLNEAFMPDDPLMSNLLSTVVPQILLILSYTANSILVKGAVMDGSLPGSEGLISNTFYLRHFFKPEKKKVSHDKNHSIDTMPAFSKYNGGIESTMADRRKVFATTDIPAEQSTRFDHPETVSDSTAIDLRTRFGSDSNDGSDKDEARTEFGVNSSEDSKKIIETNRLLRRNEDSVDIDDCEETNF